MTQAGKVLEDKEAGPPDGLRPELKLQVVSNHVRSTYVTFP
jgi:hypothetical protein